MARITQMGLTVAIPAGDMPATKPLVRVYLKALADQMMPSLQRAAGGVQPAGDLATKLDGPKQDRLLGHIYGFTVAAPFDADKLPVDCEFYAAYNGGAGGVIQADQGPLTAGGTIQ